MAQAYLFVHFREKTTPDGEQVYFGISRDGFHWEKVNDGAPVLWAYYGDKGVRDFTITHCTETGKYYIFATDLSLSYGMRNQYHNSWEEIGRNGSKCFSVWESENLVDWSDQRLVKIGNDDFGCLWAPDLLHSNHTTGPYVRMERFDESMKTVESGLYEAPTAVQLDDGRWCLFLDYYGVPGAGQGYVPFVADNLASGTFERSDASFSFPYGYKHGTILPITEEDYERLQHHDWSDHGYQ